MLKSTVLGNSGTHLVLIPGGPGLSSNSIRAFDNLASSYQLHYLDLCGTNDTIFQISNFEDICLHIKSYMEKLDGKKFILGHSFGGFIASKVSLLTNCDGLICLATPFTTEALNAAGDSYTCKQSVELNNSEEEWINNPSDKTFKNWLSEYQNLYFNDVCFGRELIQKDNVSYRFFLQNRGDIKNNQNLLDELFFWKGRKLFIAGENDGLLPTSILQNDSLKGGFEFKSIPDANHFMMWDQKQVTIEILSNYLNEGDL